VFGPAWWKVILGGLCQAMKAKIKTKTHPALTESANSGLRPPTKGNIVAGSVDPGTGA